jgi:hypothetical protein
MQFLIADTFTDSLARLPPNEQKAAKTTAFDLQVNPAGEGKKFHRVEKSKDRNFWSARVNDDIRIIVHMTDDSFLLCYVDRHDPAYDWARRRKLETHPRTGAAQLVEIRETIQEVVVPVYVETAVPKPPPRQLFAALSDDELLGYGVPAEWLADVRSANEDSVLAVAAHLPGEAAEAVLQLATGGKPRRGGKSRSLPQAGAEPASPFEHPDARRRFRVMGSVEELQRALEDPWDRWTVFLHPDQRDLVERDYTGPARVTGSAGTGKTIVALHRAAHLARTHADARVLLTTFSDPLAHALETRLHRLLVGEPRLAERIDVCSLDGLGLRLYRGQVGPAGLAERQVILDLLRESSSVVSGHKFTLPFLVAEWDQVVDVRQLTSWEAYRDVERLGRKTRLPEDQRKILWAIFERVRAGLCSQERITQAGLFTALADALKKSGSRPYDFAVVDEAQDLGIAQVRFFAALCGDRRNGLFFAGDLGQRIFQQPFSWKTLGVEVRGRSRALRVNYRTSHQIREQADRLLGAEVTDVDGDTQNRADTVSVFNGPPPEMRTLPNEAEEARVVGAWLAERVKAGIQPHEIGVFVRSPAQMDRALEAAHQAGIAAHVLDERVETVPGRLSVGPMHLAKGLEFPAVAVMACDDEIVPLQERIESVGDETDLKEVYDTERYLLYVACTRARDHLLVTSVEPASEFLDDLRG